MAMEPEASGELDGRFVLSNRQRPLCRAVSGKDGVLREGHDAVSGVTEGRNGRASVPATQT